MTVWFQNRAGIVMSASVPLHRSIQFQLDQGELTLVDPPTTSTETPKRGRGRPKKVTNANDSD